MPRFISLAVSTLFTVVPAVGRRARAGEFVGVDHPRGLLRLHLGSRGDFLLGLSVWDPVVGAYVAERELAGRWRCTPGGIQLNAPTRLIAYRPCSSPEGGWQWERSSLPTFADGIRLVPEPGRRVEIRTGGTG